MTENNSFTGLIASDMDRTMMPNGIQEWDTEAIPKIKAVLKGNPSIALAYVTGRNLELIKEGIREYSLPHPDFVVGDVGTRIYEVKDGSYTLTKEWGGRVSIGWPDDGGEAVKEYLSPLDYLTPQEAYKQNFHKQSYYVESKLPEEKVVGQTKAILDKQDVEANIIYSVNEVEETILLDVLPKRAAKDAAIRFLREQLNLPVENVLYAGDSGNDILPLTCGVKAVLVANAIDEVREKVGKIALEKGITENVYFASGDYGCGRGYYANGVLEGALHFKILKT